MIDVGCGTGRLTFVAAETARLIYAVDPVESLRRTVQAKARERGLDNIFCVDGLITDLPFPDGFADVTMGGHVFGDDPEMELSELLRVTQPGGSFYVRGTTTSTTSGTRFLSLTGSHGDGSRNPSMA